MSSGLEISNVFWLTGSISDLVRQSNSANAGTVPEEYKEIIDSKLPANLSHLGIRGEEQAIFMNVIVDALNKAFFTPALKSNALEFFEIFEDVSKELDDGYYDDGFVNDVASALQNVASSLSIPSDIASRFAKTIKHILMQE